jgi:hypothetical protein
MRADEVFYYQSFVLVPVAQAWSRVRRAFRRTTLLQSSMVRWKSATHPTGLASHRPVDRNYSQLETVINALSLPWRHRLEGL